MAGKHTTGGHAQKNTSPGKIVLIAVIILVLIAAAALAWYLSTRPVEEIPGEVAIAAAGYNPNEIPAPAEEPVEEIAEEPAPTDPPNEIPAPAEEPVEEIVLPEALPGAEEKVPLEEPVLAPPQADFAQIYEDAGIEPVYQLSAEDGLGYAVLARGDAASGISQYEFIYDGDTVVTMAETYYSFFPGASQDELEDTARSLEAGSMPPEDTENVTVSCVVEGDHTVLRIRVDGLADPAVVSLMSQIAFIPYTAEEHLFFTQTRDRLVGSIGYAER